MSFPQYPEYKDSGVEWLGVVPAHWRYVPLWTLYRREKTTGFSDEELLSVYRDHGVVPKSSRSDNYNKPSDDMSLYQLVEPGDLVINKMKAWQGSVAVSDVKGIVSPAYHVHKNFHDQDGRYFHHLFRSRQYIAGYLSNSKGIRVNQWDLEPQQHSRMPVLIPTLDEQKTIAALLDHETARIDALVEEQQRLIELLKEKRQAVISHAVTKGLDPDVPMKDSGVEWLGEVPEHWEVTSLKRFWSVTDCKHITADFVDDGIPLASIREVQDRYVDLSRARQTTESFYEQLVEAGRKPEEGDLVFSRNATVGEVAQVAAWHPPFAMGQDVCLMKKLSGDCSSDYFQAVLLSPLTMAQLENLMIGSTFKRVNVDDIRGLLVPAPPPDEQKLIALFLNDSMFKIENLEQEAVFAIGLMKERRSALISAAVTGKIDVRGWQPPAGSSLPVEASQTGAV